MYLKNVSIDTSVELCDHLYDIEKFLKINKDHPEIKEILNACGTNQSLIIKAISDYEYCHQDKDRLIEEIKQIVQYKNYKHDDYRGA